jgi:hypothetical protein
MSGLIGFAALIAIALWLFGRTRPRASPEPEDDVDTPVDHAALEEAEQESREDPGARPLNEGIDEDDADDWGPGTR